jgi:hypothetical protein
VPGREALPRHEAEHEEGAPVSVVPGAVVPPAEVGQRDRSGFKISPAEQPLKRWHPHSNTETRALKISEHPA